MESSIKNYVAQVIVSPKNYKCGTHSSFASDAEKQPTVSILVWSHLVHDINQGHNWTAVLVIKHLEKQCVTDFIREGAKIQDDLGCWCHSRLLWSQKQESGGPRWIEERLGLWLHQANNVWWCRVSACTSTSWVLRGDYERVQREEGLQKVHIRPLLWACEAACWNWEQENPHASVVRECGTNFVHPCNQQCETGTSSIFLWSEAAIIKWIH